MIEGARGILSALDSQVEFEAVYYEVPAGEYVNRIIGLCNQRGIPAFEVVKGALQSVSDSVTSQGVLAVAHYVDTNVDDLVTNSFLVVLSGLSDPGNAGTLIRSALASGSGGVILSDNCVDLYNPKTVRSCAGALFSIPVVVVGTLESVVVSLRSKGYRLIGTSSYSSYSLWDTELTNNVAVILGNEANGLSEAQMQLLDETVSIPINEKAESLNVGIAGSIFMFEIKRQLLLG